MFLVNYSQDILFLVLAFCVLWLTFFLTWLIYHLVAAARQLHHASRLIKKQVDDLTAAIKKLRAKLEVPTSLLLAAVEGLKKLAELAKKTWSEPGGADKTEPKKTA